jgi:hypothetical protein
MVGALDIAHERVREHAARGDPADFRDPTNEPAVMPDHDDDHYWRERTVDGAWLSEFLTDAKSKIHHKGVALVGVRISCDVDLEAAELIHPLRLVRCHLGVHTINLADAETSLLSVRETHCGEIILTGARVGGRVSLRSVRTAGRVRLMRATVHGDLICTGSEFNNPGDDALSVDGAQIAGRVFLDDGFKSTGTVRLLGTTIGGDLKCTGGEFSNPDGEALYFDGAQITGDAILDSGFKSTGTVRLLGAVISGDLQCSGGEFNNPHGMALALDRAQISGGVFLDNDFRAHGIVRLAGARIAGDLDCSGGNFDNREGNALMFGTAEITGAVFLRAGFRATGTVLLNGSHIRALDCSGGQFADIVAENVRVDGAVYLRNDLAAERISLASSSASALVDDLSAWPHQISVDGFRYDKLYSPQFEWRERRTWLKHQETPSPQAYTQLASVYRAGGHERDARKILMERHNALSDPPEHWRIHLPSGWRGRLSRAWRRVLRYTIGQGYEPWRVLYWAVPLIAVMGLWYWNALERDLLVPTDDTAAVASTCTEEYACVQPLVYALDTLLPIVDLGQRSEWRPDQSEHGDGWIFHDGRWLMAAAWITTMLGWILATLVASSFTGIVRHE